MSKNSSIQCDVKMCFLNMHRVNTQTPGLLMEPERIQEEPLSHVWLHVSALWQGLGKAHKRDLQNSGRGRAKQGKLEPEHATDDDEISWSRIEIKLVVVI